MNSMPCPTAFFVAPRVFTKITKVIVQYLKNEGLQLVIFLDAILFIGKDYNDCMYNVNRTLQVLTCLGYVINYKKSSLQPQN